jgi:hypothetical protein
MTLDGLLHMLLLLLLLLLLVLPLAFAQGTSAQAQPKQEKRRSLCNPHGASFPQRGPDLNILHL